MGADCDQCAPVQLSKFVVVSKQNQLIFLTDRSTGEEFALKPVSSQAYDDIRQRPVQPLPFLVQFVDCLGPEQAAALQLGRSYYGLLDLPHRSLQQQFSSRAHKGSGFKQHQLWRIAISVIQAMALLQHRGVIHKRVGLNALHVAKDGLVKLCQLQLESNCPQNRDDVLAAGVTLLSLGLMAPLEIERKGISPHSLKLQLEQFRGRYPDQLSDLVAMMLADKYRPDWQRLRSFVSGRDQLDLSLKSKMRKSEHSIYSSVLFNLEDFGEVVYVPASEPDQLRSQQGQYPVHEAAFKTKHLPPVWTLVPTPLLRQRLSLSRSKQFKPYNQLKVIPSKTPAIRQSNTIKKSVLQAQGRAQYMPSRTSSTQTAQRQKQFQARSAQTQARQEEYYHYKYVEAVPARQVRFETRSNIYIDNQKESVQRLHSIIQLQSGRETSERKAGQEPTAVPYSSFAQGELQTEGQVPRIRLLRPFLQSAHRPL